MRAIVRPGPTGKALQAVALTTITRTNNVFRAVDAGAMAFVLKSATLETVLEALRTVPRGEQCIPAAIAQRMQERASRLQLSSREEENPSTHGSGIPQPRGRKQLAIAKTRLQSA